MKAIINQTTERQQAIADGFDLSVAYMEGAIGDGTLDMLGDWCELLNGFDDNDFLFKIIDEQGFNVEDPCTEFRLTNQTYCARCITNSDLPDFKMVLDDDYADFDDGEKHYNWEPI